MGVNPGVSNAARQLAYHAASSAARKFGARAAHTVYEYSTSSKKRGKRQYERTVNRGLATLPTTRLALAKRHVHDFLPASRQGNDLIALHITDIPLGSSINDRERQTLFISGFKINYFCRNKTTKPGYLNWAIIQSKFTETLQASASGLGNEFFRGANTISSVNFDAVADAMHKYSYSINSDKFKVLHVERCVVGPASESANYEMGASNSWKNYDRYVSFNQKIRYDADLGSDCVNPVYFVTWFNPWDVQTTATTIDQIENRLHCVTYFKEVI